jgi:ATP-dependent helicase/nuclease subunit A
MRFQQLVPCQQAWHRQSPAEGIRMKATAEQQAAIQTEGQAILVNAGAGTGKTWVLVERFIHMLEIHPEWPLESILAITFTKKATREMRSRIRRAVEEKARQSAPDSHWHARRRSVDRLMVSTIHGLCARILRENAIAAGIDPLFKEIDEVEAGLLKEEAILHTLAELVEQNSPTLELLVSLKARDLKGEMSRLLEQRGTVHRIFNSLPDKATLLERWVNGLGAMRLGIWQAELKANPLLEQATTYFDDLEISDRADLLAESVELAQQGGRALKEGDLVQAIECWRLITRKGGKKDNWGGSDALSELKTMLKFLQETGKKMEAAGCTQSCGELDEQAAGALQIWKELWLRLEENYERLKDKRRALDFDDLEIQTEALLKASPRSLRLQTFLDGIQHLMVDEFQDTNQVQQGIVYALAHPSDNERLFVVGDAKQSIYRFRQAQVSVFHRTGQDIQAASGYPPIPLRRSFRTESRLAMAMNALFEQVFIPAGEEYADYEARPGALVAERYSPPPQEVAPAPVELIILPKQNSQGSRLSSEGARLCEARLIAERLLDLERESFEVWDKEKRLYRPFRMGDAAVLFRSTTDLPLYEEQLKAAGLPYLTVSGRGYYDRPEVQDMLALLASLYSEGDDLSLATVLRSPIFGLSDETLYRLRWHTSGAEQSPQPIPYTRALASPPTTDQDQEVAQAAIILEQLREMAGRAPLWQLLRAALDLTSYETILAMNDASLGSGSRQRSNLIKLMEIARESGGTSLSSFLRQIQDLKAREAREGEALGSAPDTGAVQLMSIHAAKGLEFPVVVVADLGRSKRPPVSASHILHDPAFGMVCKQRDENGDWVKPAGYRWAEWLNGQMEEAENRRLLYVACTRAGDLLILSGQLAGRPCWLQDILEAWQLSPEGEQDEFVHRQGYSIRLLRHQITPQLQQAAAIPTVFSRGLMEVPGLADPLPSILGPRSLPVTRLFRHAAGSNLALPELHLVVSRTAGNRQAIRAPAYLVGRVTHRLLADWSCLSLPEEEFQRRLEGAVRREGLATPELAADAARRARRMLENLRREAIYQEINASPERYFELPFSLVTSIGSLEGVIDLLYRDRQGAWQLIEWKTEWVRRGQIVQPSEEFLTQLALYAHAIEQLLGLVPASSLVYLNPRLARRQVEGKVLKDILAALW